MNRQLHFHIHSLIKSLVLLSSFNLIRVLLSAEQLSLYIHPRFTFFTEVADYLLLILALAEFSRVVSISNVPVNSLHQHSHGHDLNGGYILFVATLFFAMVFPNSTLDATQVSNRGLNTRITPNTATIENLPRPLAEELKTPKGIVVTDLKYTEIMSELNQFPDDYIGKEVNMTGFVFRSPGQSSNQISLVRYVITCCTADALPYGILCETASAKQYPDGTWLEIQGVVQKGKYDNEPVGMIKLSSIKKITEPMHPYVFPYETPE
ncbi:putative membrane protein [Sporomusaceae bacterium BoRhaA]|uniref:TIGR03943 family putative permease subunit n=1 Tax=Pelorhabdus rhamnosifermentans TaxID=2772457 RepID=UPI001C0621D2|nr:TIGR03943 family protein [Pelorhabdus rhamnosifermentans]MBU2700318.1 putative membrane protein [Pelorhabdus rhamnosifermentans]